ncbi:MAG: motility protein A [bacterium]
MLTFLGFLIGIALVSVGIISGAAPHEVFVNWQGLAIVIGGTIASTFVSYPIQEVLRAFKAYFVIFRSGAHNYPAAIDKMVRALRVYQREGVGALLDQIKKLKGLWIFTDGILMLSNGYSVEETRKILEDQIRWQVKREMKQHQLFGAMARISPAFGMIGTLIGLINMLITLQSQPAQVGMGLAIALTTTFYGLVLANIVFLPISEKIKERAENNLLIETMQLDMVLMLYEKRNYVYARDKLSAYLAAASRRKVIKKNRREVYPVQRNEVKVLE